MTEPFGWTQPYVVACCKCQGTDLDFFLQPTSATRHFTALAFRGWERRSKDLEAFAAFGVRLPWEKRDRLLAEAWGHSLGDPAPVLRRLAGGLWPRVAYDRLAKVMASPQRRAVLIRLECASAKDIAAIATARIDLVAGAKGELVMRLGAAEAVHVADSLAAQRPDLGPAGSIAWLEATAAEHPYEFEERLIGILQKRRLPAPPWAGEAGIRPISSVGALCSASLEFRNCLKEPWQVRGALAGNRCFYRVSAPAPAIVELSHDALLGAWHVNEVLGPRNRPVPGPDRAEILRRFAAAGFPYLPQPVWASSS